jgi:hypothetical protein
MSEQWPKYFTLRRGLLRVYRFTSEKAKCESFSPVSKSWEKRIDMEGYNFFAENCHQITIKEAKRRGVEV